MKLFTPNGNLLVTIFNGYGDAYLALPALREISRRCAGRKLYLACFADQINPIFQDLSFQFVPGNSHTILEPSNNLDFQQMVSFNAYFPCQPELELLNRFPNVERWGFCNLSGQPLLATEATRRHMRDQYFLVLGWEPVYDLLGRQSVIALEYCDQILQLYQMWAAVNGERFYVIHLDSLTEKMWPLENWLKLVSHIWSSWQAWPLIVGEENEDSCKLEETFPFAYRLPSGLGIALHFAAIKLAKVFIGIDSIFAHVADSYSKPLITLFGPSDLTVWGPVGRLTFVIKPDNGDQMTGITVSKVVVSVESLFSSIFLDQ